MDLRQCCAWQPAAQGDIKPSCTGCKERRATFAGRPVQPLGKGALDPCNFPAQGANGLSRHGGGRHGVALLFLFLLCSYGFQSACRESSEKVGFDS